MTDKPIAGVDIAKDWLDICVDGAGVERLANSAEAVGGWLDRVALHRGWWRLSRPAATSGS